MRTQAVAVPRVRSGLPSLPGDAIAAWVLPFALVLYLGLRGGGFDLVVRSEAAVLVWWVVLLLAAAGLVPRLTRRGWVAFGLLAAWAGWTAIGIPASESAERTLAEAGRLSAYVGVLVLALVLQGRAGTRHVVNGVACAIGLVTALAVLSRLQPQWFPDNDHARFLPGAARRLSYPLNYWNALAAFMGMGAVLLLGVAAAARTRAGQAMAAAAVPLSGLGVYFCVSRGGAIVLVAGVVVYLLLTADRLPQLLTTAVAGAGTAILIAGAADRDAIRTGMDSISARAAGDEMLWLCIVVCAGVGLLQIAIGLVARHVERPRWMVPSRAVTAVVIGLLALGAAGAVAASPAGNELSDRWAEFKTLPADQDTISTEDVFARLQSTAGQGRYQFWQSAVDAYKSEPLTGIGGGTFELWWPRNGPFYAAIQDAHSLYAQTLGETGMIGFLLLAAFVLLTLGGGAWRALRERSPTERMLVAGATGAMTVFWVDAAVEWDWQIAVMPVALLVLAAAVLGHQGPEPRRAGVPARLVVAVAAIAAFVPIALSLASTVEVRNSQLAAEEGRYGDALRHARDAEAVAGPGASAILQQALVLEAAGDLRNAANLARTATDAEPTNWKTWLTRSRIEARAGRTTRALRSFRRARRLAPNSPLLRG